MRPYLMSPSSRSALRRPPGQSPPRELVMRYEAAEISRIYIQSGRGVCSDQIAYAAGRTSKLIRNGQLLRSASGYNRAIHLFARR